MIIDLCFDFPLYFTFTKYSSLFDDRSLFWFPRKFIPNLFHFYKIFKSLKFFLTIDLYFDFVFCSRELISISLYFIFTKYSSLFDDRSLFWFRFPRKFIPIPLLQNIQVSPILTIDLYFDFVFCSRELIPIPLYFTFTKYSSLFNSFW